VVARASWTIPEKGIADLLETARLVLAEGPRSHSVLAGSGAHLEEYKKAPEQFGIASHVTFTGMLDDPLTDGLFASSNLQRGV
jgi:glycosyltransferase involved in cell wall biosynthesis